jgi:hypothetical protein
MTEFGSALFEQHVQYLQDRGVSPEVARERGYRSADTKASLRSIGFGESQRLVPGLIIPTHDVVSTNGECSGYQYRPDTPRAVHGRVTKFETPRGARLALDIPPRVRQHLANPDVPLWFTEGGVKADSAVSHGLACVALFGVYGWRAKNDFGGTAVVPQLEWLHLKGRRVYLAFDSDVVLKPQVHDALSRLYGVLNHRGADVAVVLLPAGEHGEKTGLDDYFVRGGTVDELLMHHVTTELPKPPALAKEKDRLDTEPVAHDHSLAELLGETCAYVERFIVLADEHQSVAVALWVAHAWLIDAFDITPRLLVTAPTKRAAKSRLLDVLSRLVPRAKRYGSASGASMFRAIDKLHPTLLVDEVDRVFRHVGADPAAELVAQVINIGFERGNPAVRVEGSDHEVVEYETFAPLALAGIDKGSIPDTVVDRSVRIAMRRRRKHERVEKFRRRGQSSSDGDTLRGMWAGYVTANPDLVASLSGAYPNMPDSLHDRAADIWEPILAISDAAGCEWPALARASSVALTASEDDGDDLGVTLLTDIRTAWSKAPLQDEDEVTTKQLVDALLELEESPWPTYGRQGKGITGKAMANILRPFEIKPGQIASTRHHAGARGYTRAQFDDAWGRYCEPVISRGQSVAPVASVATQGNPDAAKCRSDSDPATHRSDSEPLQDKGCDACDTSEPEKHGNATRTTPSEDVFDPRTREWS